jgi:hypothetical protein
MKFPADNKKMKKVLGKKKGAGQAVNDPNPDRDFSSMARKTVKKKRSSLNETGGKLRHGGMQNDNMSSMKGDTLDGIKGKKGKKKMTQAQDDAYDRKHGIKEGSKRDIKQDRLNGIKDKKKSKKKTLVVKKSKAKK